MAGPIPNLAKVSQSHPPCMPDTLGMLVARLRELTDRVGYMSNQLDTAVTTITGPQAEPVPTAAPMPLPSGLLDEAALQLDGINIILNYMAANLDRLSHVANN